MRRWLITGFALLLCCAISYSYGALSVRHGLPPYSFLRTLWKSRVGDLVGSLVTSLARSDRDDPAYPQGRWQPVRKTASNLPAAERRDELVALGYVAGSNPATDSSGVIWHDRSRSFDGINLLNSGHSQSAALIDMEGNKLHSWAFDIVDATDPSIVRARAGRLATLKDRFWRRVELLENGELLALFSGLGIVKIDRNSSLIWHNDLPVHHDIWVSKNGLIYTLVREQRVVPMFSAAMPILDDSIVVLDSDGRVKSRLSILDAFENSEFSATLSAVTEPYDVFHTNSIQVLDGGLAHRSPAFREGNILISIRNIDTLAIVDMEVGAVVWTLSGLWHRQHDPVLTPGGGLLVFDNLAAAEASRVLEIDPFSQEVLWSYQGSQENPFYSRYCGTAQTLENGNFLITESDAGRAFEITAGGDIVWEFYNPERAGEQDEFIATLFEVRRLPAAGFASWGASQASAAQ